MGPKQVLPLRVRMDLGVMVMKATSHFPVFHDSSIRWFSVISRILVGGGVLPFCREAVGVFLELWRMRSTSSLSLLSGQLLTGVVLAVRVPSMGQIELFHHLLCLKPFNSV